MKKQLTILIALMAMCSFAFAQYDFQKGDINYKITSDTIPYTVEVSSPVTYATYLNIVIPNSVIHEGNTYAVTTIGEYAFAHCNGLTNIAIPNSVTTIGEYAFFSCSNLVTIMIGNSVTTIGNEAFLFCGSLRQIDVAENNLFFSSIEGVLFNKNKDTLIRFPMAKSSSYTIPNEVTSISDYAFYFCSRLAGVIIHDSVTTIGEYAFSGSSLFNVTIGNSVTSIGNSAFSHCNYLSNVTIGNSVATIGEFAFSECTHLTDITIPNSVTTIGENAFFSCSNLTNITIGNSVTSIGDATFFRCTNLSDVILPNSVTTIGNYAFSSCIRLTNIAIPNSVTSIGNNAFFRCTRLAQFEVATDNTFFSDIDGVLFNKNQDTLIRYPEAKPDTSYTIPNSVTAIGHYAFSNCIGITNITTKVTVPPTLGEESFFNISKEIPIYVPCQSIEDYQAAEGWSKFTNIVGDAGARIVVESNKIEMGTVEIIEAFCEIDTIIIQAIPTANHRFVQWQDGNTDNPRTVTIADGAIFIAEFGARNYTIIALSNDEAMGSVTGGGDNYTYNSEITLTATPTANHRFVKWQDGNTENPRMVTITEDATYTAEFASTIGISESIIFPFEVYAHNNTLVIKQAEGQPVTVFDMMGRIIFQTTATEESTFNLPTAGVYVVRVGESFARKVVIN